MKCYCYETETEFVFCVENADAELEKNIEAAWFHKVDNKFLKIYPNTINDELKELFKRFREIEIFKNEYRFSIDSINTIKSRMLDVVGYK